MKKIFLLFAFAVSSLTSLGQHGTFTDVRLVNGDSTISGTNNGTIFYNRVSNKFRFRQNGAWASYILSGSGLMASNNLSDVANKSTSQLNLFPTATALQGLRKNAGNTAWEAYTPLSNPATTNGDILYWNGTSFSRLGIGSSNQGLRVSGGIPAWGASLFTASNGLTATGSDVALGGSNGVTNTTLSVAAGFFSINGNVGTSTSAFNTYRNGGAGNSELLIYNESASGVGTYFSMDHANQLGYGAGAVFTDTRASKRGIEYAGTGYVTQTHSFADKEYVDAHNTVGGSNTQLQYNSSGVFGGISTATYNSATTRTTFTAGATNAALNIPPSSSPAVPTSGDLYGTSTPTLIWHDGASPRSIFMGSNTTTTGNIPYFSNTTNSLMTSEDALNYNTSSNTLTVDHIAIGGTFSGQTTLVSGTKAITVTGATSSSRAFVQLVSPSGATLTVNYQAVCTTNTITIQANVAAGTINTADGSTLNYIIYN